MNTYFVKKTSKNSSALKIYDGSQLKPLFAYENFSLKGNSILSWISPCRVDLNHMVDYEDKIVNSKICGDQMLHFMIEFFPANLAFGVVLQRLFASQIQSQILKLAKAKFQTKFQISRQGDDLYVTTDKIKKGKLSISIASVSAVSTQIHFALNIVNQGTPVKTASLSDLDLNPESFALDIMKVFAAEFEDIIFATQKVKPL